MKTVRKSADNIYKSNKNESHNKGITLSEQEKSNLDYDLGYKVQRVGEKKYS